MAEKTEIPTEYSAVIERTDAPVLSDVWPEDLTYSPRQACVGHVRPYELGGKDLRALLVLEDSFARVRPKQELHVVCDDGNVYVWSRFGDSEPWTFDYRQRGDGEENDTVSRQLPGIVEAIVEQRELLY